MAGRTVHVPRLFHELHGETTTPAALLSTYVAVAAGTLVVLFVPAAGPATAATGNWWRVALAALVAADLFGGLVATFTAGADRYYTARPRLRFVVIAAHAAHPLLLLIATGGHWFPWIVVGGYAIAGAFAVNAVRPRHIQEPLAAALVAVGILLVTAVPAIRPVLPWFAPVFLVKLVLGFSVRRSGSLPASHNRGTQVP